MKRLFDGIDRKTADLVLTILASQGIQALVRKQGSGGVDILVADQDSDRAADQLDRYARENPQPSLPHLARFHSPPSPAPFLAPAALAAALVLAAIHLALTHTGLWSRALFAFGASPYFLSQGETFRAITALFLHSDAEHLMGNLAGVVLLGSPLVRITGPGTGLLLLLAAATGGNLISNSLSLESRLSIGASTAVMAAAGLLASRQAMTRLPRISFWQPLAAGLILTAMFSHGPRTDVGAHFFGFATGAGTGLLAFPLFTTWHRPWMEPVCLVLVLVLCGSAFWAGLPRIFP